MNIGCYGKPSNILIQAIYEGAEALGLRPFFRNPGPFKAQDAERFDLVIANGVNNKGGEVLAAYEKMGVPAFVVDLGYIYRDMGFHQFGIGGLNWLPKKAPDDRAKQIGLVAKSAPKQKRTGYILVVGQKPGDNQHKINVDEWRDAVLDKLRQMTDEQIVYRPHPRVKRPAISFSEALAGARCVVTHNSTAAYEAIIEAVPVICDPEAAYAECAETDLEKVLTAKPAAKGKRQELLSRVACAQWTYDEFRTGQPLAYLWEQLTDEKVVSEKP